LLFRTFNHFLELKSGFDASNLVAAKFSLQDARYRSAASIRTLMETGVARIRELPGVQSAAAGLCLPYERPLNNPVRLDGQVKFSNLCYATPEYFKTPAIREVASEGIILALAAAGCVLARFASQFLHGMVFGLSATDAAT